MPSNAQRIPSHNNTDTRIPTNEAEGNPPKRTLWVRLSSCIQEAADSQILLLQVTPPSITPHPADRSNSVKSPPTLSQSPAEALGVSLGSIETHFTRLRKYPLSGIFHYDSDEDESVAIAQKRRRRLRQGPKRPSTSSTSAIETACESPP